MSSSLTIFIDRMQDWFTFEDSNLDVFYCSISLLERLSTRTQKGINYNRVQLINSLINRKSPIALKTLDSAIVVLSSRKLITIAENSGIEAKIYITSAGKKALDEFKKVLKNVH